MIDKRNNAVTVRLDDKTDRALDRAARIQDRKATDVARIAIELYLFGYQSRIEEVEGQQCCGER